MSKKNNDSNAVVWVLTIGLLGIVLLFKSVIALIIAIISIPIKILNRKNKKEKQKKNEHRKELFNDDENITKDEIKKKLGLFSKEIYDYEFMPQVIKRGEEYYSQGRIYDYNIIQNIHTCKIKGTEIYDVSIMFNEEDGETIESMSCTCPHYMVHGQNCKHIYALLYKIKCANNMKIIKEEVDYYCDMISDIVEETKEFDDIKRGIDKIQDNLVNNCSEEILLNNLVWLIHKYKIIRNWIIKKEENIKNSAEDEYMLVEKNDENISMLDIINEFFDTDTGDEEVENISGYTQEEIDAYALQDFEEKQVKQGLLDLKDFKDEN